MPRPVKWLLWGVAVLVTLIALLFVDTAGGPTILYHTLSGGEKGLSFSFNSCGDSPGREESALSSTWLNHTLIVEGVAHPNCAATWLFGSYELNGSKLDLSYHAVQPPWYTACECTKKVKYEIDHLPQSNYEISISEGEEIRYTPLLSYFIFNAEDMASE